MIALDPVKSKGDNAAKSVTLCIAHGSHSLLDAGTKTSTLHCLNMTWRANRPVGSTAVTVPRQVQVLGDSKTTVNSAYSQDSYTELYSVCAEPGPVKLCLHYLLQVLSTLGANGSAVLLVFVLYC